MDVLYTNADAIRATLGLTDRELYDNMISDLQTEDLIIIELETVFPLHAALHQLVEDQTATPDELRIWRVLQQYVKYEAAAQLLPQFQMIVTQKISDGDVEATRFGPDLQKTVDDILAMRDKFKYLLNPDLATASWPLFPLTTVQPDYDPVTDGPYLGV